MELAALVLAAVLLALTCSALWRRLRFWRAVDKIPGPLALPLVGTAYMAARVGREERLRIFDEVTKKYWPIFRGWMGPIASINISKPEHMEKVLGSSELITKAFNYRFLFPWLGEGLLTSAGEKWFSRRKMITPAFHFKILDTFVEVFGEKSEILIQQLRSRVDGEVFDIYPFITRCALDIICETAMGTSVNAQNESESEYVTAVYNISTITVRRIVSPWLYNDFIFRRSPTGKEYYQKLNIIHSFTKKVIKQRKEMRKLQGNDLSVSREDDFGQKSRLAFLDLLLDASENGRELTDNEIQEEVDTFMFEGHDTTSVAMCWAIFLIGNNKEVQEKLVLEQKEIFGDARERFPTLHDLNEMKYLEMVIKETLRLYPSVPFIGRKATRDIEIGGYTVPEGCMFNLHIYHAHRDPDHWPQPDRFDPDRFLPDRVQQRHPYSYIPFSAGPRNCIGQRFALLEEKTVLSFVLRNFRIETVQRPEDVKVAIELIMKPIHGIPVRLTPR